MKNKFLIISLLIVSTLSSLGQDHPTGLPIMNDRMYKELERTADFTIPNQYRVNNDSQLPKFVNNANSKYFPKVFLQTGNSCAQASCVGYMMTYEMNAKYERDASLSKNNYNYFYIWNFLNEGVGLGGFPIDGFKVAQEMGLASKDFYNNSNDIKAWMNGYDKYYKAAHSTVESWEKIDLYPGGLPDQDGIMKVKQYLFDHGNGSKYGGLLQFSAFAHPLEADPYTGNGADMCNAIIPFFGKAGMHSMIVVGYNDNVEYDYNGNDIISDDEKGAFLCVNTWGTDWGDKGFFYAPYRTFIRMQQGFGGTGNGNVNRTGKALLGITVTQREPKLLLKVNLKHNSRNDLVFRAGVSDKGTVDYPMQSFESFSLNHSGGDRPMTGSKRGYEIELGLNVDKYADYLNSHDTKSVFLIIKSRKSDRNLTMGEGKILYCSLLDYRNGIKNPIEYTSEILANNIIKNEDAKIRTVLLKNTIEENINSNISVNINEVSKKCIININAREEKNFKISLLDEAGALKSVLKEQNLSIGLQSIIVDYQDLDLGQYILKINTENRLIYKPLIVK